jgi:hypothetical protein
VGAWGGVTGDGGRVEGTFLWSVRGLRIVSCGQFGFHGEAAHLPRNAWKKRAVAPRRNHPVLLLRSGRPAVPLQRAYFSGGAVVAYAISWRLHITGV